MDTTKISLTGEKNTESDFEQAYQKTRKAYYGGFNRQELVQYYNQLAEDSGYDLIFHKEMYNGPKYVAQAMASCFSDKQMVNVRLLDVAAGTGLVGAQLIQLGFRHIDALDPSPGMFDQAKEREIYEECIEAFVGFGSPVPDRTRTCDGLVVCGGFGEGHIPCEALAEMIRLVKPGGIICFAIRQEYLEAPQYKGKLEPFMERLQVEAKWKLKSRATVENFAFKKPGCLYIYEIL